jgi:pullulanase
MEFKPRIFLAYLDEMNIITVLLPLSYHNGFSSSFTISYGNENKPITILESVRIDDYQKYTCSTKEEILFDRTFWITDQYGGKTDLQIGAVIRTPSFDEKFYYPGNDLGVTCENDRTIFKLWAPTASKVKIKLIHPDGSIIERINMKGGTKGVWTTVIHRDLEYYRYTYLVCVNLEWQEAVDPYVNAVTENGHHGVIVKLEKTRRVKPSLPPFEHPLDAIIYETHIRDFTIHQQSGVKHKGLYLGAGETGTKGKDGQLTGLSYLKSMGITHIEFLPFNDFAGVDELKWKDEYNWGYNPLSYNVPEGSYSTDPANPYSRIIELKQLIEDIHGEGLRVIMDVVYNHVYKREESSFEKIVPGYYFRHNELGFPSNGTGVGNDLASERLMVRKFILDSIRFWIEEYHVDGFRFDLMGILDVKTINEVREICSSLQEGILLLGEGWNLNTPLPYEEKAALHNQSKLPNIGQFNDRFRDSIKGSTFNLYDKGYAFGNVHYLEAAIEGMAGSIGFLKKENRIVNEPVQSVNYVECHDNHTMWDKLESCYPDHDQELLKKFHRLATCMVLLAQGIPFLHSGQEFFRTKYGVSNSYRSPDSVNQLDWDRNWKYLDDVEYIKGIIEIRKKFPCFRIRTAEEIRQKMRLLTLSQPIIGFSYLNGTEDYQEVILFINPSKNKQAVKIPDSDWYIFANGKNAMPNPLCKAAQGKIILEPVSINVFAKK